MEENKNATIYAHPTDLNFKLKNTVKLKSIESTPKCQIFCAIFIQSDGTENIGVYALNRRMQLFLSCWRSYSNIYVFIVL